MIKIKKSESTTLKGKAIAIAENKFVDYETGEEIDMVSILSNAFGELPFDLTAVQREDVDAREEG